MDDLQTRPQIERDGLLREREGARHERLRGDDRREGREHHHRYERPTGGEREERVGQRVRIAQQERALSEIARDEGGEDDRVPPDGDRRAPEMREIRVERLDARHAEHDRAEDQEAENAVARDEMRRVTRIERDENAGFSDDRDHARDRDRDEPNAHDGSEELPDLIRSARLYGEEADEDRDRDRDDERIGGFRDELDPFDGREDRNRRRDDAVAEEHRGAEHDDPYEPHRFFRRLARTRRRDEREQREDAAFPVVIDPE